ncbi:MAG: alanine racemase [Deltaproteobacteria bacterium]|nr:alanine racemase [Deltaproteobacteria bacterium]
MSPIDNAAGTCCIVDLSALRTNLRTVRRLAGPGVELLAVVKADAYGHGDIETARALCAEGVDRLGVATVAEGARLREAGVDAAILVLGSPYPGDAAALVRHSLDPVVASLDLLRHLDAFGAAHGAEIPCHLKLDTGMGRLGLLPDAVEEWLPGLDGLKAVRLQGVMSHFARAEEPESQSCRRQLQVFRRTLKRIRAAGHDVPLVHMANSAAIMGLPEARFNMVRPGGMLYGIYSHPPLAKLVRLAPVLTWKTRVLQLKTLPKHSPISYGGTFVTCRESVIATVPVGYADGYKRSLSNKAAVLIRGRRAPVVGRVTMDLTMADVTAIDGVQPGDEVVLLGTQDGETISAEEIAGWADTISYEILTSISRGVPRRYIGDNQNGVGRLETVSSDISDT